MEQLAAVMMQLIRSEVCGEPVDGDIRRLLSDDFLKRLYRLSKSHDLAHLVGAALDGAGWLPQGEVAEQFRQQTFLSVYRYERMQYELTQMSALLEQEHICFIPLKGAVMRQYYPEPWMRTSCDVDILVHREDLERAREALAAKLHYRLDAESTYDVALNSESGVHLELHYSLLDQEEDSPAKACLMEVWSNAAAGKGGYAYELSDAMFYTYHIYHMAKHIILGGCGVRPLLDTWILNHRASFDPAKRLELLRQSGLDIFAAQAEALSEVWFTGAPHTELTAQLQDYILQAGVYGNLRNKVAVQQVRQGGKIRYLLSRIWMPYHILCLHYPSLNGRKWLLPFYEIRRWCGLLFGGGAKRGMQEMSIQKDITDEQQKRTRAMLQELGLTKRQS